MSGWLRGFCGGSDGRRSCQWPLCGRVVADRANGLCGRPVLVCALVLVCAIVLIAAARTQGSVHLPRSARVFERDRRHDAWEGGLLPLILLLARGCHGEETCYFATAGGPIPRRLLLRSETGPSPPRSLHAFLGRGSVALDLCAFAGVLLAFAPG